MSVGDREDIKGCVLSNGNGFLQLTEECLRKIIRTDPITDVYHVEQTPFARGKFAAVRKVRHLVNGSEYAAKFIRKRRRANDTVREIHHEIAVLLQSSGHARLVRLHEVYDTRTEVALVLELAAGGELQSVLDAEECVSENVARGYMRQILEGLCHLHSHNVAHLDLKPQNLLLTTDYTSADAEVKLCDFGISRVIEPGVEVREILGTPDYVAPEVLSYEPISLSTDIWSVGVLAYVLLSGYSPFGAETKQETYLNISQCSLTFPPELFSNISSQAKDFICSTLVIDPRSRPTAQQCMEHPWLEINKISVPHPLKSESIKSFSTECHTPVFQRKCFSLQEETIIADNLTPTSQRKFNVVSPTCISCAQCGATCCHITNVNHSVSKPVITIDRGIIC